MSLQPHILVIEDNLTTRLRLVSYLRQLQYRVSEASDAAQAEAILAEQPAEVLIVDINLDGKDGLQITREQRARSNVGIILLTARTEQVDRIVGLELGADDYITKPFDPRELAARVKNLVRRVEEGRPQSTMVPVSRRSLTSLARPLVPRSETSTTTTREACAPRSSITETAAFRPRRCAIRSAPEASPSTRGSSSGCAA